MVLLNELKCLMLFYILETVSEVESSSELGSVEMHNGTLDEDTSEDLYSYL